ncbi:hypothetical protein AOLI_G00091460 [Acnodon oligacanthus]
MAEGGLSLDQFSCPVCLELLKDPVTVACGHSFCKVCINDCWDQEDLKGVYSCPQCRCSFAQRPAVDKNTMLAEVVENLKMMELHSASPAGPGDVECDVCTGRKLKALRSCLVCLVSYCETHLQPHYQSPAFKKHKLVKALSITNCWRFTVALTSSVSACCVPWMTTEGMTQYQLQQNELRNSERNPDDLPS